MAKRLDSRYEPGRRTGAWLKIKHTQRQELVIGGWIPGEGRRSERIGALLMGVYDGEGENRRCATPGGSAPGSPSGRSIELAGKLAPLRCGDCRLEAAPKLPRNAVFVEPRLVAEVEFREWTSEGIMRAPSFKGLRDDKDAGAR